MSGSRKSYLMMALATAFAAPLLAQTAIVIPTTPAVDSSFRQHDWDVVAAEGQIGDGKLLIGDRYALRPTLDYVSGLSEKFVSPDKLLDLRRKRFDNLIKRNRRTLDRDSEGQPVVRDRVLLVDPGRRNWRPPPRWASTWLTIGSRARSAYVLSRCRHRAGRARVTPPSR